MKGKNMNKIIDDVAAVGIAGILQGIGATEDK